MLPTKDTAWPIHNRRKSGHTRSGVVSTSTLMPVCALSRALAQRRHEAGRRVLRGDAVPRLGDPALLVDEERRALDAHVLAAVHRLLAPHAVGVGHGVVLVGQQREPEAVLLVELALARRRIGT